MSTRARYTPAGAATVGDGGWLTDSSSSGGRIVRPGVVGSTDHPAEQGLRSCGKDRGRGAAGVRSRAREHAPQERVTGTGGIMNTPGGSLILHP